MTLGTAFLRTIKSLLPAAKRHESCLYVFVGQYSLENGDGELSIPFSPENYDIDAISNSVATWLEWKTSDGVRYYGVDGSEDDDNEYLNLLYVDPQGKERVIGLLKDDELDPVWDVDTDKFDKDGLKKILASAIKTGLKQQNDAVLTPGL